MNIREEAANAEPELIELRRCFHRHPELGWHEFQTQKKIEEVLSEAGIPFLEACKTGVIAEIAGKNSGDKILGIRADIDALPIKEETGLPFSSENEGAMHACGHDAHAAILLETAKILYAHRDDLKIRVRLFFQPSEEYIADSGAYHMRDVKEVLECTRLISLHIFPAIPSGQASIEEGPVMASADTFDIRIQGKAGHGAHPEQCINPIAAGVMFHEGVNRFLAGKHSPLEPVVISITSFHSGTASNIIPAEAHLSGTARASSPELRDHFEEILKRIAAAVQTETGAAVKVDYHWGCPVTINDPAPAKTGRKAAEAIFGKENVIHFPFLMEGEDFSKYRNEKALLALGGGYHDPAKVFPQHSPHFLVDESALKLGLAYFLQYVKEWEKELFGESDL